jgi:proteasome lid subunit RPN8/RPN11
MMKEQSITLPLRLWQEMKAQVSAGAPLETCGLLAGHNDQAEAVYPISNTRKSPVKFRMDPYEQLQAFEDIEKSGLKLLAIYHSHPTGPEIPSPTDIEESRYNVACLIWSARNDEWQVRAFWLDKTFAAEMPLYISEM